MILTLDCSTNKTGFGIFKDDKLVEYGIFNTNSEETKDKMKEIYNWISSLINKYNIQHIIFEDVPVSKHKNLHVGKILSVLQGVILTVCFEYNIESIIYSPSRWRSIVGTYDGTREGTKREIQKQKAVEIVNKKFKLDLKYYLRDTKYNISDDDVAEAILLGVAYLSEE